MLSNLTHWTETPSLDTDDLFSFSMDEFTNQYEDLLDDEIFISSEEEQISTSTATVNTSGLSLICGVCGAKATGYNFDQITCESCKAFFRRNALRDTAHLRCRFSGSCVINIRTRRQCTYCRLKKCFDINMRKDWIRTDEEKQLRQLQKFAKEQKKLNKSVDQQPLCLPLVVRKKKRLMIKPTTDNSPLIINQLASSKQLADDIRTFINNINNAYNIGARIADWSHIDRYEPTVQLSQCMNDEHAMHASLISFYKSIPHFRQLDIDDQVLLIKNNLVNIVHLHYIIVQNFEDVTKIGEHMSRWIGKDFHNQMADTRRRFYRFSKYPLLLELTLSVFIFSFNLSLPRPSTNSNGYKQRRQIIDCQNIFTTFLWNYITYLFDEKEAVKTMEIIVTQVLRYQNLMIILEEHLPPREINDQLMRSIFRLS